jgi:hypothetical protein
MKTRDKDPAPRERGIHPAARSPLDPSKSRLALERRIRLELRKPFLANPPKPKGTGWI